MKFYELENGKVWCLYFNFSMTRVKKCIRGLELDENAQNYRSDLQGHYTWRSIQVGRIGIKTLFIVYPYLLLLVATDQKIYEEGGARERP